MPLKRETLERQLSIADENLELWIKTLDEKGVDAANRKRDPKWRKLAAARRQLCNRLQAVSVIEQREEDCAQRKAGATASADAE